MTAPDSTLYNFLREICESPNDDFRDWSRGFISEITLTCTDFMQHAEALFDPAKGGQPITKVVLSNKRPVAHRESNGRNRFGWLTIEKEYMPNSNITFELFKFLVDGDILINPYRRWWYSEQLALDALSDACVRFGRIKAGLKVEDKVCS